MIKIKLGVIGVGNMGTSHIKSVIEGKCPEIEITAAADTNPERLEWVKSVLPNAVVFENADNMLESGIIDSVLIAVPHYDHPRYAIAAMKLGLHVMVEKPAGVFTKAVKEMNAVAKESGVIFGMMFNQRTDHIFRTMRALVQSGELGEIRRTSWIITNWYRPQAYYDSGGWRATWAGEGGGVLLNQCPHNLDLWQWICGMPTKILAKLHYGKWHDIEVEDDVTCYAEYENGATGTFITSTADCPGTNRFEITMDGGKLVAEDGKLTLWKLDIPEPEFSKTNSAAFGNPKVERIAVDTDGNNEQHVGVLNAFAGAILHNTPLIADGSEGIFGLTLSNAMHLSDWTNTEINLPLDEDLFYTALEKRIKESKLKNNPASQSTVADMSNTYGTNH